jgi:5-methyltetrahydropteroyltriglutamate--homocysteine methyltransferase
MKTSRDRILTTHTGALPRPEILIERVGGGAGTSAAASKTTEAGIQDLLRSAVADVVRRQLEAGIDVVNDGEFGKTSWTGYVNERLRGFEARPASGENALLRRSYDMRQFAEYYEEAWRAGTLWHRSVAQEAPPPAPVEYVCTAPITYDATAVQRDISNFQVALSQSAAVEAFMPVAAPASIEVGRRNQHYASEEQYVYALAEAMREEYRAITDAGFVVQIDDAWIPALWDRMLPDADMDSYLKYVMLRVEALNHALRDIDRQQIRYHLCWGSWHGPHVSDIPMKDILNVMLSVKAGAYVFEAANVRHEHEYHLWEATKLPDGCLLIPGVVSHATNVVEHPELIAERIQRFAERVGRENVLAGTDCGLGGRVHPQIAWAKLNALSEGARLASRRL